MYFESSDRKKEHEKALLICEIWSRVIYQKFGSFEECTSIRKVRIESSDRNGVHDKVKSAHIKALLIYG